MSRIEALYARVERELGLSMDRGGTRRAIERFLESRRRTLGLRHAGPIAQRILAGDVDELARLIDAVTVPHSWFHRDPEQWRLLASWLRERADGGPIHAWVPACAGGEDVYTLALLARHAGKDVRILGTDINEAALKRARRGRYGEWALRELPSELTRDLRALGGGEWEVEDEVRRAIRWARHNLMHPPPSGPSSAGWDLVLCRNVLFYFPQSTALAVAGRLAASLAADGRVVLGASDMLHAPVPGFRSAHVGQRLMIMRADDARPPGRSARPPAPPVSTPELRAPERTPLPEPRLAPAPAVPVRPPEALDPLVHLERGVAAFGGGETESAIEELRAALFLAPELWPADVYLGMAYERARRVEEAARAYARAVASGMPRAALGALPAKLRAYSEELAALARGRSRRRTA